MINVFMYTLTNFRSSSEKCLLLLFIESFPVLFCYEDFMVWVGWSISLLVGPLVGWLSGWSVGWLVGQLVSWLAGRLVD